MLSREEKNKKKSKKVTRDINKEHVFKILKKALIIVSIIIGSILYARFISTYGITTREYSKIYENLDKSYHGLKIIHFSDVLYGNTTFKKEIKDLTKEINKLKPDIVIFTGDLVDKNYKLNTNEKDNIIKYFSSITPTIGKYMVNGNLDNEETDEIMKKSGFTPLNNQAELIYKNTTVPIYINGIDSTIKNKDDVSKAFEKNNKNIFTITIMHETNSIDTILDDYNVDIIMAGHSRNGQIRLPFIGSLIRSKNAWKYYDMYYHVKDTDIYISGGIGTSTVPFRLFNRPSINFYRLRAK